MTYEEYCNWFANVGPNCVPPDESIFREYISPVLERVEDECDRLRAHVEKLRKQVETADAKVAELEDALSDANAVIEKFAEKPEPENENVSSGPGDNPFARNTYRQLAGTLDNLFVTAGAIAREMERIREGK